MKDKDFEVFVNHIDKVDLSNSINISKEDEEKFLETLANPPEPNEELKKLFAGYAEKLKELNPRSVWDCYQMIADEKELKWFFDHVIQKPQVNESYSAVFVSRHKKLTKEEQETIGLTRKEAEFLATQTFRLAGFKDALNIDEEKSWTFDRFLQRLKRFNVDKGAYTTSKGEPIPSKTLAVIFYVNPCDDIKVCREFFNQYLDVSQSISKAMLGGKTYTDNLHGYQWFGNAENNLKHLKANQKGTRYWMDFDIDVPKWFKENSFTDDIGNTYTYYQAMTKCLDAEFKKGNYIIVDTSGGYHVLVKTSAIKSNPHDFCKRIQKEYEYGISKGEEPYLDEKGNCKFECIVNDSQIPGLPLPGTYQYDRPVTVLNKEDFD
jgi:hypothetical protein